MASSPILALADDLTGALETGAMFAAAGLAARVIDTESRHLAPERARAHILSLLQGVSLELLFKKTDSTLRGNIGPELAAIQQVFPAAVIQYAPAYPALGRTVREGTLYVDGVPVHKTAFSGDPLDPVKESHIPTLLSCHGVRVELFDAVTDDDVRRAAQTALKTPAPILAAGPAAFAAALAELIDMPRVPAPPMPRVPRALIVNGSLHPASAAQIETARKQGLPDGWRIVPFERTLMEAPRAEALIVFGGDTTRSILRMLGDPRLFPVGEILPGVPVTRAGDRVLVTKAGGFGPPDLLVRLASLLCDTQH